MTEEELILTSLLGCRRIDLYVDRPSLTPSQENRLLEIHRRRKYREPLQYILTETEFMGLNLFVDDRVFIPRPETELLVEAVLQRVGFFNKIPLRILDMGTGSGNIAISLATYIERCEIIAVDISREALKVAEFNATQHQIQDKIQFIESDVFSHFYQDSQGGGRFDMIVSNPPYISEEGLENLPQDVQYEPRLALDGGKDGLKFYERIIKESPLFLNDDGFLFFEIGEGQTHRIENTFLKADKFKIVEFRKDYTGKDRIVIAGLR